MYKLLQCGIVFAVAASNIKWKWTPNGYLVAIVAVGAAFGATVLLSGLMAGCRAVAGRMRRTEGRSEASQAPAEDW